MCKVIAICNQKGGVSKTTTTVNLGVGMVREGKRVLVIDADPQGNLSQSLGIENPDELEIALPTIMEQIIMDEEFDVSEGIIHHVEGIDLMPCNIDLSGVDVSLVNAMSREFVLKTYVDCMREKPVIRVMGEDKPAAVVKSRLLKLDRLDIDYAIEQYNKQVTKVRNHKAYMLTVLYQAKAQCDLDISNQVMYDFYGAGQLEDVGGDDNGEEERMYSGPDTASYG